MFAITLVRVAESPESLFIKDYLKNLSESKLIGSVPFSLGSWWSFVLFRIVCK